MPADYDVRKRKSTLTNRVSSGVCKFVAVYPSGHGAGYLRPVNQRVRAVAAHATIKGIIEKARRARITPIPTATIMKTHPVCCLPSFARSGLPRKDNRQLVGCLRAIAADRQGTRIAIDRSPLPPDPTPRYGSERAPGCSVRRQYKFPARPNFWTVCQACRRRQSMPRSAPSFSRSSSS